jgi:transposase
MSKSKTKSGTVKKISQLTVINPSVAAIDVSDSEMMVAFPKDVDQLEIRPFGTFTRDLNAIASCLKDHGVTSVAMESTGVYWVPLFLILQERGFEVILVNAKHVKNVTGRKDDESDAEWLQKLHSCGLLSPSFQPDNLTRTLRDLVRQRKALVRTSSTNINRIQKALELMNIKIHTVISDIDGKTGTRILEAILSGERNPAVLANLSDPRIKASREEIIKSLEGCWTREHLFTLRQDYELHCQYKLLIRECDKEIEQVLIEMIAYDNDGVVPVLQSKKRKVSTKNKVAYDLTACLNEILGVDLTEVEGLSELSVLAILSEAGTDMSKWKTVKHFKSWLGVAPNNKISGGKLISSRVSKKKHWAGQAFRQAASSLHNSKGPLGQFFRRIRAKSGTPKAVVATAGKLATIYYCMIKTGQAYNPQSLIDFQQKNNEKKINQLRKKLAKLEAA